MHGEQQLLDSYQNPIDSPRHNRSVEAIDTADDNPGVESPAEDAYRETAANYAADGIWESDEDAERLVSDVGTGAKRGEDESAADESGRGRAASGEAFEDEEDDSLFFPRP